jgi:hypothetical protein
MRPLSPRLFLCVVALVALLPLGWYALSIRAKVSEGKSIEGWLRKALYSANDACSNCDGVVPVSSLRATPVSGAGNEAISAAAALVERAKEKGFCSAGIRFDCTAVKTEKVPRQSCNAWAHHMGGGSIDPGHLIGEPVKLFGPGPEYPLQLPTTGRKYALLVSGGTSSLALEKNVYDRLRPFVDVWAMNNIQWHPVIVPDFWHMEPMSQNIKPTGKPLQTWGQFHSPYRE